MLCLLYLEQELSITIHVVKDLSTQILRQVVEQLRVLHLLEWIASLFVLLGLVLLILGTTFPIIISLILRLAGLCQLLDLGLDLQNFVSDNVQVIGLYSHLGLDLVNLLFLNFDLL